MRFMEKLNEVLGKFIKQSQEGDLKTAQYPKEWSGFNMKVSFGMGETFSRYYPDKEPQMYEFLNLALNPVADKQILRSVASEFGSWLQTETKQIYGSLTDKVL